MASFKHSGDLGDIIYSLPTVKALGGGVLFLDVTGGESEPFVQRHHLRHRTRFNPAGFQTICPLLLEQAYIQDVRIWQGEAVDFNLDRMRPLLDDVRTNLVVQHLRAFGLDESQSNEPWLTLRSEPITLSKPILINRSVRYHSKYHVWAFNRDRFVPDAIFIGLEKEHDIFQYTFECELDYHKTQDALEIARVLKGSRMLIANQSFIMSIAIGLGTAYMQETHDYGPNCVFKRSNGQYF